MPIQPKFQSKSTCQFSRILRERVNDYFKENRKSTYASTSMHVRTVLLLSLWIGTYYLLMFGGLPLPATYGLWVVHGVSIVWVAVNIGHDAIHGSYTKNKFLKNLLSHTFNLNGASAYMWKISHNHAHHSFTNIHGHDEDISPAPFIRICPETELLKVHRFQHLYCFMFYCFATISWLFAKDYVQFFGNKIGNYNERKHPKKEYFLLFFYKAITYTAYFVVPFLVMPSSWIHILTGLLIMHFVAGFYLAIIFMLAHAVEEVHFPLPTGSTGSMEDEWIKHQMATTANFASQSRLTGFLTGGLNLQVEHHLFPNIATIHYRSISEIVKTTAREYNVPYFELPSFWMAVGSHYRFLKKLGTQQEYLPIAS